MSYLSTLKETESEREHGGNYSQETDPVRRICGAHGVHKTAEVRDVRRSDDGGRGLRGGAGKRVNGISPGRPQRFSYQRRPVVDDCSSPGRGEIAQDGGTKGAERFMAKWIAAEKARAGLRHAVVCPNVTGRTKKRVSHKWRELVSPGVFCLLMTYCLSLAYVFSLLIFFLLFRFRLFFFCFLGDVALSEYYAPFIAYSFLYGEYSVSTFSFRMVFTVSSL